MLETDRRRFIELLKEGFAEYGALLGNSGDEIKQNLKVIWDAHQDVDIKDFKKKVQTSLDSSVINTLKMVYNAKVTYKKEEDNS